MLTVAHICTHIYTYTYTYIHIHTYTHLHTQYRDTLMAWRRQELAARLDFYKQIGPLKNLRQQVHVKLLLVLCCL